MGLLFLRAHWWCMIDGPLHATHCSLSALTVPSAKHSVSPQLAGTKRYLLYSNCFSAKGSRRGSWEVKGGKKKKCVLWSENKKEKPNTLILVKKVCTWQLKKKIVIITGHCIIDRWKFRFYSDQLLLSFSMLDSFSHHNSCFSDNSSLTYKDYLSVWVFPASPPAIVLLSFVLFTVFKTTPITPLFFVITFVICKSAGSY